MFSFIFVTHGKLGETMINTAEFIMKKDLSERCDVFSVDYSMLSNMDKLQDDIKKSAEKRIEQGQKVIIFVDIFGGSPSNVAFTLAKMENVDIVSGVNLPMVIYTFEHMNGNLDMTTFVSEVIQCGSDNMVSAKKLLISREKQK